MILNELTMSYLFKTFLNWKMTEVFMHINDDKCRVFGMYTVTVMVLLNKLYGVSNEN